MSNLLFSSLLFLNVFLTAQESISYKATRQTWHSGVCCNYGINYAIELSGNKTVMGQITVDTIVIDEVIYSKNWKVTRTDDKIILNFGSNFTRDHEKIDLSYEVNQEIRERVKDRLVYHLGGIRYEIAMKNIETLFPIPYP